ncbi:hypothetical protein PAPYR_6613 [Paratrimastix pyriformis]|uniref:Uncharacterized protein n=1 Tax=Paratrimastix pyriformis TaxID=342808 RepID=A0ABQ8UEX6_9EUKA|nr:hypothetical protein PAPYR_6613 [Paratrimastix pyriformis]
MATWSRGMILGSGEVERYLSGTKLRETNELMLSSSCGSGNERKRSSIQLAESATTGDQFRSSTMEAPVVLGSFLSLPPDLLSCIVEASGHSIQTYIQLLSLSRGIRLGVRGVPRELSFGDNNLHFRREAPRPTADALAALIGPCQSLIKLTFPSSCGSPFDPNIYGCGATEAVFAGWVNGAFGGHHLLTVLEYLPTTVEPAIECILRHLPGLLILRLGMDTRISTHLLSALAQSCPHLQVLQSKAAVTTSLLEVTPLAPLAGSLQQFRCCHIPPSPSLDAFVGGLSAVGTLHISHCPSAALAPLASHLTRLSMRLASQQDELPGPWLSRLERLSLRGRLSFTEPLAQLLAASQATIQRLKLATVRPDDGLAPLLAALDALPRLTHLSLHWNSSPRGAEFPGLPDGLAERLEHLTLGLDNPDIPFARCPLAITSSRLQCLRLRWLGSVSALSLDCPALVEVQLPQIPPGQLSLRCSRLRLIANLPAWFEGLATALPDLEMVGSGSSDPIWLPRLLAGSHPRLRNLPEVRLTRADLLASVCACGSLIELRLWLDLVQLANPLVLRLPQRLQVLVLSLCPVDSDEEGSDDRLFNVQVDAPGLRLFQLTRADYDVQLQLGCPALTTLHLSVGWDGVPVSSLELDERARLHSLTISGNCDLDSMLDLLSNNGERLEHLKWSTATEAEAWPQLVAALEGLPRLARLELDVGNAPVPLSLACPPLRTLQLETLSESSRVVLTCPLLEMISSFWNRSRQLTLAVPAPNLPPHDE